MKRVTAVLIFVSLTVTGCSSMGNKGIGAIIGAGIGGTVGGLIDDKDPVTGALIGAAAGAAVGFAIGHYYDKKIRDAEETAKVYKYDSSQGTMVEIENVRIEPETVIPGKSAKLVVDYAVLNGDPDKGVQVTEKTIIKTGKSDLKEIGPVIKTRKSGTYSIGNVVVFPSKLSEGQYRLRGQVIANGKTSTKEAVFDVSEAINGVEEDAPQGNNSIKAIRGFAH